MNKIISFYQFKKMSNLEISRVQLHSWLYKNKITGTVLLATEGINVNICGETSKINNAITYIKKLFNIKNFHINENNLECSSFKKLKVKIKNEIIKVGFNANENLISKNNSVDPIEWNNLLQKDIAIIDIRNKFEFSLGSFEGSQNLNLKNFSDLSLAIEKSTVLDKKKDVAIFCTGGIRCEKASVMLRQAGFKNIFQLKGGILNYINNIKRDSKWKGECFVFDDRVTIKEG